MQYLLKYPKLKLYYNKRVYSPAYTSVDVIMLADKLIKDGGREDVSVLDVGCGTGILGLGIKKLHPEIDLTLCDVDFEAVKVAKLNAKRNGLACRVKNAHLAPQPADIIVANLPTYNDEDMRDLHGPDSAYYGPELNLYEELFKTAKCRALVCECQEKYREDFLKLAKREGWVLILNTEFGFALTPGAV